MAIVASSCLYLARTGDWKDSERLHIERKERQYEDVSINGNFPNAIRDYDVVDIEEIIDEQVRIDMNVLQIQSHLCVCSIFSVVSSTYDLNINEMRNNVLSQSCSITNF